MRVRARICELVRSKVFLEGGRATAIVFCDKCRLSDFFAYFALADAYVNEYDKRNSVLFFGVDKSTILMLMVAVETLQSFFH